jgi:hypothetical protein
MFSHKEEERKSNAEFLLSYCSTNGISKAACLKKFEEDLETIIKIMEKEHEQSLGQLSMNED